MRNAFRKIILCVIAALIIILIFILFNRPKRIIITENNYIDLSIRFNDDQIHANRHGVEVVNNVVYIKDGGKYELMGKSSDARIEVDAPGKDVELILNSLHVNSKEDAVIYIKSGNVTFDVKEGTINDLSDIMTVRPHNATIYSEDSIKFIGKGTLYISGKYSNVIHSMKDVEIDGASYYINAQDTALYAANNLKISSGNVTISSCSEGLTGNNVEIKSGITTITSNNSAVNGTGSEGLVTITGGEVTINSLNGGINASKNVLLNGGNVLINNVAEGNKPAIYAQEGIISKSGKMLVLDKSLTNQISVPVEGSTINGVLFNFNAGISSGIIRVASGGEDNIIYHALKNPIYRLLLIDSSLTVGKTYNLYTNNEIIRTVTINGINNYSNY